MASNRTVPGGLTCAPVVLLLGLPLLALGVAMAESPPPVMGRPEVLNPNAVGAGNAPKAAEEMVVDVRIVGNRSIPLTKIVPHIRTRAGRPFSMDTVQEDVRRLNHSRLFVPPIKTFYQRVDGGVVVVFEVLERPSLQYIKYLGNSNIKTDKLKKEAALKVGDPFDPLEVEEARRKIESYYQEKGYSRARVTLLEGNRPDDHGAIFLINEGQKQKILWTKFVGNTIASDARLRTQIDSTPGILWIFKGEVDRKKIDEDINKLTAYYRGLGFFRAKIGRELEYTESGNWLVLTFVIDEGPRYVVRNVSLIGNTKFETSALTKDLKLTNGKFFNQNEMLGDVHKMQDMYGHIGYVFANVQADPRFLEEPGQLDLVYNLKEGDRYRVGRVNVEIKGDTPRTKITTVWNRMSLVPGDVVDTRELRDSERRLKYSGLFKNEPQSGKEPRISFTPPDKDTEVARDPQDKKPRYRGQSPEPSGPYSQVYGPDHRAPGDDGHDRYVEVRLEGEWNGGSGEPSPAVQPASAIVPQPLPAQVPAAPAPAAQSALPSSGVNYRVARDFGPAPSLPATFFPPDEADLRARAAALAAALERQPLPAAAWPDRPATTFAGWPKAAGQANESPAGPRQWTTHYQTYNEGVQVPPLPPSRSASSPPAGYPPSGSYGGGYNGSSGNPAAGYPAAASGGYQPFGYSNPQTNVAAAPNPPYPPYPPAAPSAGTAAGYGSGTGAAPPPGNAIGYPPQVGYPPATASPPAGYPPSPPMAGNPGGYPESIVAPPPLNPGAAAGVPSTPGALPGIAPPLPAEGPVFSSDLTRPLDLNANIHETETGRFMLGVGINSDAGLVGQIMIDERNFDWTRFPRSWEDVRNGSAFRGAGQGFRIELVPGTQLQRYTVSFTEPYLFDTDVSMGLSGYYYDRAYTEWTEERVGGKVTLGYQFSHDLTGRVSFRGERINVFNPLDPYIREIQPVLGHPNIAYGFGAGVAHDTRDSQFLPTEGHLVDFNFEQVEGTFEYPHMELDARQHFTLTQRPDGSGRHVLTLSGRVGYSGPGTPIYDNYFAGGFSTIRGFGFRGASPVSLDDQGIYVGGQAMVLASAEYMFPITADDMLRGVVFCDTGAVQRSFNKWTDNYRVAPGFGLRITIPALGPAPIALDLAFPVAVAEHDHVENFSFFIGIGR